jgi:transcriptional regulator with XRE-family HTH domain
MKRNASKKKAAEAPAKGAFTASGRPRKAVPKVFSVTRTSSEHSNAIPPKSARAHHFGRLLQAAMLKQGVKQIQLAELSGIGRDSISGYCNGKNIPGNDNLKKLADVLNVEPRDLLPTYGIDLRGADANPAYSTRQDGNGKDIWVTLNRSFPVRLVSKLNDLVAEADAEFAKRQKGKV